MASRRDLKKSIKSAREFLFYVSAMVDPKNSEKMYEAIYKISELITRISHTEPGNAKKFYKAIVAEYNQALKEVNEIIESEAA